MIVYYNQGCRNSYTSNHLDFHTKENFNSFVNREHKKIKESPLVFLLHDGSPAAFAAVQKAVYEKNIGYTRLIDAIQLISWYKYWEQPDGVYKYQLGRRMCEFDNYDGLIEVMSCEYINDVDDNLESDLWSTQNIIALTLEACDTYKKEVIDSKDGETLLLDVVPFDIKLFGKKVIAKNTTVPWRSSIELSIGVDTTPLLSFELSTFDKSNNILVPLPEDIRGKYKIRLDLNTSGDIVVSLLKPFTEENIYTTSLRYYDMMTN